MTAPPTDQATLDTAVALVRAAGERTLRWFRSPDLAVERKGDGTPVTAADKDAERYLREQLSEAFPGDGVLGEEEEPTPSTTGRRWILDPIDGTKAFTCGVPLYSNLLALEDEHGIAIGVVNLPALGETVWAGRGLGCWSERGPAHVSDHPSVAGGLRDVELAQPLGAGAGQRAGGRRRRAAHLGRRVRLRPGGHRPGGGDGRPHRGPVRHRADARAARTRPGGASRTCTARTASSAARAWPRTASCTTSSSPSYDPAEPHSTWSPAISSSRSARARATRDRIVPMGTPHTSAASA